MSENTVEGAISAVEVTFASRQGLNVLHGLSTAIAAKERVALVGKTGAGKSTFARLLARLYAPDRGRPCWRLGLSGYCSSRFQEARRVCHPGCPHLRRHGPRKREAVE